jgi:hypothetical protein
MLYFLDRVLYFLPGASLWLASSYVAEIIGMYHQDIVQMGVSIAHFWIKNTEFRAIRLQTKSSHELKFAVWNETINQLLSLFPPGQIETNVICHVED